jgi:glutamate-1-semialdehyde 2,1-aminomutase
MRKRPISHEVFTDLCKVIPGGVNSPVRTCAAVKQLPLVASHALGDKVYDVDGHGYIDYCGSWGALIHGHSHPAIVKAAQKRVAMGSTFGMTTHIELLLANKVVELMPSIEQVRFVSSGTEATMTAARLARGVTKREIIVKFNGNYHGHADFFLVQAGSGVMELSQSSSVGIPADVVKNTVSLPYNDVAACRKALQELGTKVAAVIIEPIAGNIGVVPATSEFLQMIRDETKKYGALLIFDEVISGFRVGLGGAQAHYGIKPDITCLGKIIGGGFPAAAFGASKEIMSHLAPLGSVYQAGTLSGNPVAMEAGLTALTMLSGVKFYEELERKTNVITRPVKEVFKKKNVQACVQQVGSMFTIFFGKKAVENLDDARSLNTELFGEFFRYLFDRGIYIPPMQQEAWFVSAAHEEKHLEVTRDCIIEFIKEKL